MMDTNIYYVPKHQGVLITSDFAEIQRRMDFGMDPKIEYKQISVSDFDNFAIKSIGFKKVDDNYFQSIKAIISQYEFETIAFHHSVADLSDVVLDVKHLIVGEGSKINIASESFKHLNEITFLSVKTFKGKNLNKMKSVEKLILWYENKKSNAILSMFPNLKEFYIYNGGIVELDLRSNPLLDTLQLHRCTKMERVVLNSKQHLKKVIVEACNKLDMGSLGRDR